MKAIARGSKSLVPKGFVRRISTRMRRAVKRRMKGESRRQWIERNLHDSEAGVFLDVTQCTFGFGMVLSIINQNWDNSSSKFKYEYLAIDTINLLATAANLGLRFYSASNRRSFLFHWLSLVEIACVLPLIVEIASGILDTELNTYFFRLLVMLRVMRLLLFYRLLRLAKSAKFRQGVLIALTTLCIIICAAIFMQTIEYCDPTYEGTQTPGEDCQNLTFLDSIYFVCITIGTVGFGDVAPKSDLGKTFDVALIFFAGALIPMQIGSYSYILSRETAFDKKYECDRSTQHVLLCGEVENGALLFFLHNWLHKDEERRTRRKVVILAPTLPSNNLRRVLLHPEYEQRVIYLQGSAMVAADLQRAAAPTAEFCFVMVKKHNETLDQNDTAANLITCSVRKNNRHAPLHVQVSKFDNTRHFHISGATAVICLEQLKLAFFGKCLWIRGLNPFLGNLIQKFGTAEESRGYWLSDYLTGCSHRICEAAIPAFLLHMPTYRSLAVLIYREFGVPIVGLRTIEDTTTVFPIDEQLADGNFLSIFFIGRGNSIAPKIERLTPAVFTRHPDIAPVGINSNQNLRTVTGLLSAAIDHKMPSHFRRLSIGFGNDKRSAAGPDTFMRVNTRARLASSRGLNLGIFSSRGQDKISPLDRDEDVNENEHENSEAAEQEEYAKDNPEDMGRLDGRRFSRMDLEDSVHSTPDQHYSLGNSLSTTSVKPPAKPIIPVIALSPAELIAKATTPRGRFFKDPVIKHLSSPRSQQSTRGQSARESSSNQLTGATSPPSAPVNSEANGPSEAMVEQNGSPNSIDCSVQDGPNLSDLTAAQGPTDEREGVEREGGDREGARLEEGGERVNSMPESALPRPSVVTSGNLRTRIRHLSMCFRREPPPATLVNHFVICGTPSNYADFLANLSDLNETVSALVFVTPRTLTEKDFHAHQLHEHLYFVRGSPLSMHVFHVARMFHARSILIMSYCGVEINREQDTDTNMETLDENMADVDAITTHRFISEALQNELSREASNGGGGRPTVPFLVAEMIRPSNVKFLIDRSGSLYDEKSTVNVARERELLKDLKYLDSSFFCPLYASGHIYFSNFMDALMGSCSNQQLLIEMVTQLVISGNMSMNMPNRVQRSRHRLTQIPAPTRYHFRPYALLVEGLLHNEDIMTLGIYRGASSRSSPQCVLTNPPADELVTPQDLLFVIK